MESGRALSASPAAPPRPRDVAVSPRRVLLVGGDSVVTRTLLVYLRKEGFDAAIVSEEPAAWAAELAGRPLAGTVQAIVLSPGITGPRRATLCRRLRQDVRLGGVPVLALRDPGDENPAANAGAIGGPARTGTDPAEHADLMLSWPFRLREVQRGLEALMARAALPRVASV
jgi:CheY-like chemotaxis protein